MSFDRSKFYNSIRDSDHISSITDDPRAVDGTEVLLDAWDQSGLIDEHFLAYMGGTAYHESAHTMRPIEEYGKGHGHAYGKPTGPYRQVYDGRGLVQLTWEKNYAHATQELRARGVIGDDIDLEKTPTLAMRPDIAAAILIWGMVEGWFTGKKLGDFFNDTANDPENARTIINGHDRAALIANYYWDFLDAIQAGTE